VAANPAAGGVCDVTRGSITAATATGTAADSMARKPTLYCLFQRSGRKNKVTNRLLQGIQQVTSMKMFNQFT
jgi:hypothetical protein